MPFFKKDMAGLGWYILNAIRLCNIVCLSAVVAASFVMLVKTFVVSKFFFFDGVSHLIAACVAIGLIITEVGLFRRYVANNWPLLSPAHGFVTLGIMMITLGVSTLGNLNKEATSQKSLGTPMWRCVISAGILTSVFGVVNVFASYMFRKRSLGLTARQIRTDGSIAAQTNSPYLTPKPTTRHPRRSFFLRRTKTTTDLPQYQERTPSYRQSRNISAPVPGSYTAGLGVTSYNEKRPMTSHEEAANGREGGVHCPPVVGGVQRPDLAHHPAFSNGQQF